MSKTLAYSLTIEFDEEERGYLAYFPALPGCHTWGETYEEAVKNAEEALGWLSRGLAKEWREYTGRRPPRGRRGFIGRGGQFASAGMTIRLPSCTARDVDRALKRGGFTVVHQRGSHRYYASPITGRSLRACQCTPAISSARYSRKSFEMPD
jgi:predicted RNase H-like HicB family nuclease